MNKLQSLEECMKRIEKKAINEKHARLERRIATLERKLKPTNEMTPVIAKIMQVIIKNLPLILKSVPMLLSALKSDQINDNDDKIEKITKFAELGQEIIDMFSDNK